ncbi:hypothetical protein AVEN_141972-1 [Araneus ventricosus]|uniref:DDE-1 domain-containing protein n=1 Tax=Araneus ventricosus TaxID=182803 RepID=A0A4Y2EAR2_ARAVE|nr:hypothetical protein AVEN_141972-1 [Araneus ventricosus]
MIAECREIALCFDNCPTHPKKINQKLKHVTVFTCHQTLHQNCSQRIKGVIKNLKIHYRKRIVRQVITALQNNQSTPKINLWESISEISKAWNYEVTHRTIRNSFAKAGFFVSNENSASMEDEDDIPLEELRKTWM